VWRLFFFVDIYRFAKPKGEIMAGQCLTDYQGSSPNVRIVECNDPAAGWLIVDVLPGATYVTGKKDCGAQSAVAVVFYEQPPPWLEYTHGTAVCVTDKTVRKITG
jgi:hypothetical protein